MTKKQTPLAEPKPVTFDELMAKQPTFNKAYIVVDSEVAERWRDAIANVDRLRFLDPDGHDQAMQEIEELRPQVAEFERCLIFKSIGRKPYEDLVAAHQPTDEQRKDAKALGISEDLSHNPDTFPPALLAASGVAPAMTLAQASELWNSEKYSAGELALLFNTAQNVNAGSHVLSLGKESERTIV